MPYCPNCGDEYREGFPTCKSCSVGLVDEKPELPIVEPERRVPLSERILETFPVPNEPSQIQNRMKWLCWIMIGTTVYLFLHYAESYYEFVFSGTGADGIFRAHSFFSSLQTEQCLIVILALFLAAWLIESRRNALLISICILGLLIALWNLVDLALIIPAFSKMEDSASLFSWWPVSIGMIGVSILAFMGGSSAFLANKLRMAWKAERAVNG